MGNLEELARLKFTDPPLSAAEERVVRAAPNGAVANCIDLDGGDDPEKADTWPKTRNVRADLIRWLCVDREARELVDPRGIQIRGARITGDLDLSSTNVLFPLLLSGCHLEQRLRLQWAKMPLLSLASSWTKAIDADGLKLEDDIFLASGFHTEGGVRLLGATIGGSLDADGGRFKNLNGNALNAERMKVTGGVFLRSAFSADGTVQLHGAEIKGYLVVDDAWLDALDLESAHITGSFFWRNIHQDHHPDFPDKEWKPSLDLTDAKVGSLLDQAVSWPEKGRLRLDGFVYDRIRAGPTDAKARLRWLRLQPDELGFRPQPYEQLIAVLRRMGHEHQVAKVAIAKQKDLRKRGHLGPLGWIRSWFLCLLVGYGYKPLRAFGWLALLVLIGTCVFTRAHSANVLVPSDKEAYESDQAVKAPLPHYYPQFNAFVYSLDVIFPFDLGEKSHWRLIEKQSCDLLYWIFEGYSLFQLFIGWVLLLVAAAVPTGFIKKD